MGIASELFGDVELADLDLAGLDNLKQKWTAEQDRHIKACSTYRKDNIKRASAGMGDDQALLEGATDHDTRADLYGQALIVLEQELNSR